MYSVFKFSEGEAEHIGGKLPLHPLWMKPWTMVSQDTIASPTSDYIELSNQDTSDEDVLVGLYEIR